MLIRGRFPLEYELHQLKLSQTLGEELFPKEQLERTIALIQNALEEKKGEPVFIQQRFGYIIPKTSSCGIDYLFHCTQIKSSFGFLGKDKVTVDAKKITFPLNPYLRTEDPVIQWLMQQEQLTFELEDIPSLEMSGEVSKKNQNCRLKIDVGEEIDFAQHTFAFMQAYEMFNHPLPDKLKLGVAKMVYETKELQNKSVLGGLRKNGLMEGNYQFSPQPGVTVNCAEYLRGLEEKTK